MPAEPEVLRDGTRSGKEVLDVTRGLASSHVALSLTSRLMRMLRTVVPIPVLAMLNSWKDLAFGGSIALELVRDDNPRDVR